LVPRFGTGAAPQAPTARDISASGEVPAAAAFVIDECRRSCDRPDVAINSGSPECQRELGRVTRDKIGSLVHA
jgi:hypothetical protein